MHLTPQQLADFDRDGFLHVRGVLTAEDLDPVKAEITEYIDARAVQLQEQGLITNLHREAPFSQRIGLLGEQEPSIVGFDILSIMGKALFKHLHNPQLLDCVESIIGPEISCNPIQHLRTKPPAKRVKTQKSFYNVPWHQDSGVTTPDSDVSPIITCWMPIGRATEEMGCMRIIPGVHKHGHLPHIAEPGYGTQIHPDAMPDVEPVLAACEQGDVIIMHPNTPHHSTPNLSDECRWSLDLRYHITGQPSGRDHYPSFVVRSASNPGSVMTDHAEWCRLWKEALARPKPGFSHRTVPRESVAS